MSDASEFRQFVVECRKLATQLPEHREALLKMAALWERLAQEAERGLSPTRMERSTH